MPPRGNNSGEVLRGILQLLQKSLTSIRATLDSHLRSPPFSKPFSIIVDSQFNDANKSLNNVTKTLGKNGEIAPTIDNFTLLSVSWVIRAKWREIQRFVRKFRTMKSIHDMQFWVFYFPKKNICTQGCGRIYLERMDIVEIILLKRVFAIHFL